MFPRAEATTSVRKLHGNNGFLTDSNAGAATQHTATMSILVGLHHATRYSYDRAIALGPQVARLRPAPHCRTRICSYSLTVTPTQHFVIGSKTRTAIGWRASSFPRRAKSFP